MRKRPIAFLLVLSLLFLLLAAPGFASPSASTKLTFSVPRQTVLLGETLQITVFNQDFDIVTEGLTWESSAPDILSVDDRGRVTAHTVGAATIYATDSNGVTGSAYLLAAEFYLSSPTYTPYVGQTVQISVHSLPGWQEDHPITWSSSDNSVATVDQSGLVTCHAKGRVYINALTPNGNGQMVILTVDERLRIISTGISSPLVLPVGSSKSITFQATGYDFEDLSVTTGDPDTVFATIRSMGLASYFDLTIRATAPGSTRVTIRGSEGDTLSINVVVPSFSITREKPFYQPLFIGRTEQFYAKDTDGNPVDVTWSSANPLVASVDQNGIVTPLDYGTADIIATDASGASVHSILAVLPFEFADWSSPDPIGVGQTTTLALNIAPGWEDRIRFASEDPTIAQVNGRGEITGLKVGTTTIEISTDVSEHADLRCSVTVKDSIFAGPLGDTMEWSCDLDTGSTTITGEIPTNHTVYVAVYDGDGRMADVVLFTAPGTASLQTGEHPGALRLFLLDGDYRFQCDAEKIF